MGDWFTKRCDWLRTELALAKGMQCTHTRYWVQVEQLMASDLAYLLIKGHRNWKETE